MFLAGVGDQALSSAGFAMLGMPNGCPSPRDTLRVAPGGLRERLTFRRWRVGRPLDGGLARQPALRIGRYGAGACGQDTARQKPGSEMAALVQKWR